VLTSVTRFFGVNSKVVLPKTVSEPVTSVYTIPFELINGDTADLSAYRGKKIVVVNTASDCGYTGQYEELQKLYAQRKDDIVIVGFPANDFKQQEKGSNEEIASFCKKNYGVDFPLAMKTTVIKSADQHPIFKWLSDQKQNGWNEQAPSWNFSKYIIDEQGKLIGYFDPGVSPLGSDFINVLNTPKP
jgi:glutathione peroxidase